MAKRRRRNRWLRAAMKNAGNAPLTICADAEPMTLEAAAAGEDGKPRVRKFSMTAYTGGAMSVAGYYWPIIADLAGMTVPNQRRPMLKQHDPEQICGHTESIELTSRTIKLAGLMSGVGEAAKEVTSTADNGFPWQGSIGTTVQQLEFVDRGSTVKVNGMNFTGPVYVARKTTLKEVSFVPLGGDDNTSATIAAQHTRGNTMGFNAWLKAKGWDAEQLTDEQTKSLKAAYDAEQSPKDPPPANPPSDPPPITAQQPGQGTGDPPAGTIDDLKAELRRANAEETRRINSIRRLCAAHDDLQITVDNQKVDLEAHAIEEGWTTEKVELHILRAARPRGPSIHIADTDGPGNEVIEAALCRSLRVTHERIEADYSDQTLSAADRHYRRGLGLQELIMNAAFANGYSGRGFRLHDGNLRDVLRAAFSTADLSGILSNSNNKAIMEAFNFVEQAWREVAAIGEVNDFKVQTRYRLTGDGTFEEIGADGKLKHGTLDEASYTNQADTYGRIYGLTRKMLRNDDLGALNSLNKKIGRGSALKVNDVFWSVFLNNSTFFKTANGNYQEGAGTALDSDALTAAVVLFDNQTDEDGHPLGAEASILLHPHGLQTTAGELYESGTLNTGGASTKNKVPNKNVHAGKYKPVKSRYLSNSQYTGSSALAWYLLADPMDIPVIEIVFLDGQQTPYIESADADFDELGIQMKGFFDFGAEKQEYRGGVKSKGEA